MKNIDKYLHQYSEIRFSMQEFPRSYDACLVIPMSNEFPLFTQLLDQLPPTKKGRLLVIIVINNGIHSRKDIKGNNQQSLNYFKSKKIVWKHSTKSIFLFDGCYFDGLIVDKVNHPLPEENVGLARKLGTDIAIKLYAQNQLSTPWVHQTDADALLPHDYWKEIPFDPNITGAITFPFKHDSDSKDCNSLQACQLYEISLRHYRMCLQKSYPTYAYHTIGSTLALSIPLYCKVRGYPKRTAGEDFYLLNKLRKISDIAYLHTHPIILSPRVSTRTPFGTGQNVLKILENNLLDYPIFHQPKAFDHLNIALKHILNHAPEKLFHPNNCNIYIEIMQRIGLSKTLLNQQKSSQPVHKKTGIINAFDGLKILRFLHDIRDNHLPFISLRSLLKHPMYDLPVNTPISEILDHITMMDIALFKNKPSLQEVTNS